MADIKKMLISGIRSFGPDDNDKQLIEFKRPLTLILGENGCGKTTIIESLKYVLCGELPPNCERGQSFVHDPKVNKSSEVLAQIRLLFDSPNGTHYLIVRSMQAQLKQKKMEFKSIDSTICIIDDHEKPIEISGRCGQTDATIASILGVSKAILNNVIFCHQEDSNWPLEEGKKLKERFDAIFDATKYNKCFESIRKMRKQFTTEINTLELNVKHALERKQNFDAKKLKIVAEEEKISNAIVQKDELASKIVPLQERLGEINEIERNIMEYRSKKEVAKAKLDNLITQERQLRMTIKSMYIGSDGELQNEIDEFENLIREKQTQVDSTLRNVNKLISEEASKSKQLEIMEMKKSELFTLEGQNQDRICTRNKQLLTTCELGEIQITGDIDNEGEATKVMALVEKKRKALAKNLKEFKEKSLEEEKNLQINVDSCRDAFAQHKQKIICRKQERDEINRKLLKLKKDISSVNQSKDKLDSIRKDLEESERNIENISEECNTADLQESINKDEMTISVLEKELEDLDKMISKMQAQQTKQMELNLQKATLSQKEKTATRFKNKNRDTMMEILGRMPDKSFKETFLKCQLDLKNEVTDLNKSLKLKQHEITTLESRRTHQKDELTKKNNEVTLAAEQLYKYCGKLTLEDKLSKLDADISVLQDQKIEVSSFEFVTRKFVEKLNEEAPCCPLCHRGFESQQEVSDLISELGDKIRNIPKNLDSVATNLSRQIGVRDQLVSMRPLDKKLKALKSAEIPAIEKDLDKTEKDLQEALDSVDELQMSLSDPERKLESVASMLPDMSILDQASQEIITLTKEIAKLEAKIDGGAFELNLEDATSKQGQDRKETNRLRAAIKTNQTKLNNHSKKLQLARNKNNQLKEESLKIQAKIQEVYALQTQQEGCEKDKEKAELDLKSLAEVSHILETELQITEKKKNSTASENRLQEDNKQKDVNIFEKNYNIILGYNKEIQKHEAKNVKNQLEQLKEPIKQLHVAREQLKTNIQTDTNLAGILKDELSNQELNKRDLVDNMNQRQYEAEQKQLRLVIKEVDDKIGELDYASIAQERQKLLRKQNDIINEKAQTEGIIKNLQDFVKEAKAELRQSKYRDVYEDYKKKFCELILMKAADKDLKDYSVAMDLCLMKFHKEKMSKINNIIRDMWRNIYRGNDIDYIEIKTDENADTASGNKRVYNYRVVQKRKDIEIDMRGRCSAGQKVLACLIIRMALAETFSNRFGVLALDEPTTNLDKENVTSLCNALGDMVLTRMKQKNFMFIIITHDAEFLTSLGRIDKLTHYYKVTRNQEGRSRIDRLRMT